MLFWYLQASKSSHKWMKLPKQRNCVTKCDITIFHVLRLSPAAHIKYTLTFYGYTTNWKSDQLLGEACELRSSSFMACDAGEPPTRDFSGLREMESLLAS